MIELTTFVQHGFEDFTLYDPTCPVDFQNIWIEYGGRRRTGTVQCCDVETTKDRDKPLEIEGFTLDLIENENLAAFDQLIRGSNRTTVRATLVGRFFAGHPIRDSERGLWGGFGHLGAYSLFVIREVKEFDPHDEGKDLDYGSEETDLPLPPYHIIENTRFSEKESEIQKASEFGKQAWRFDEPVTVAVAALRQGARLVNANRKGMTLIDSGPGRRLFQFDQSPRLSYFVEVRRPYWLSFYAKDPGRVVWVATLIRKAEK